MSSESMKHVALLIALYVALVLDSSLSGRAELAHLQPGFVWLVLMLSVALCRGRGGHLWAGLIGLASDGLSSGRLGIGVAACLLVAWGLGALVQRFRWPMLVGGPLVCLVGISLAAGLTGLVRIAAEGAIPDVAAVASNAGRTALAMTALAALGLLAARIARGLWLDLTGERTHRVTNQWTMLTD